MKKTILEIGWQEPFGLAHIILEYGQVAGFRKSPKTNRLDKERLITGNSPTFCLCTLKSLDSVTKTVVPAFKNGLRLDAEKGKCD